MAPSFRSSGSNRTGWNEANHNSSAAGDRFGILLYFDTLDRWFGYGVEEGLQPLEKLMNAFERSREVVGAEGLELSTSDCFLLRFQRDFVAK